MAGRTRQPKQPSPRRLPKPKKAQVVHVKKPLVGHFHEAPQNPRGALVGHQGAVHLLSSSLHAAGGSPAVDLMAGAGLTGVILDLVGEGRLPLVHALDAFQREQERVANRAWRRPGGMVRMGGL